MSENANKAKSQAPAAPREVRDDTEALEAIAAFEQILESVPNDRVALQALHDAHEQLGDTDRAHGYLVRIANVIAEEGDVDAGRLLLGSIEALMDKRSDAKQAAQKLRSLLPEDELAQRPTVKGKVETKRTGDITAEMTLAWNLHQSGELNQNDYSQVVADLSENSSKSLNVPVSVLHVLTDRGATNVEKILSFLARDSGFPIITLQSFELQLEACALLPLPFMQSSGAIPFECMGQDVLIAVLNPYNTALQEEVKETIGRRCHFYLLPASEYDAALEKIEAMMKESAEDQKQ